MSYLLLTQQQRLSIGQRVNARLRFFRSIKQRGWIDTDPPTWEWPSYPLPSVVAWEHADGSGYRLGVLNSRRFTWLSGLLAQPPARVPLSTGDEYIIFDALAGIYLTEPTHSARLLP